MTFDTSGGGNSNIIYDANSQRAGSNMFNARIPFNRLSWQQIFN